MYEQEQARITSPGEVLGELVRRLKRLIDQRVDADGWMEELTETLVLLESLPLSTSEFDVATRRLNNARRYLASSEQGAARYELRLLIGGLTSKRNGRRSRRRVRQDVA